MNQESMSGFSVVRLKTCGSTNVVARERITQGLLDDALILTAHQTQGRGRQGREWISPTGSLAFSVILPAPTLPEQIPQMGMMVAFLLGSSLQTQTRQDFQIKWPNDLLIHEKKVGGILCEYVSEVNRVIVGIGINLNCRKGALPPNVLFPAGSVSEEAGKSIDEGIFLKSFLADLRAQMAKLASGGWTDLSRALQEKLAFRGQKVSLKLSVDETITGTLIGLDTKGQVVIETSPGVRQSHLAGDLLRPV